MEIDHKRPVFVVGCMSGTSLDGLDICLASFQHEKDVIQPQLIDAITVPYPRSLSDQLAGSFELSAFELKQLDIELGRFIGEQVSVFLSKRELTAHAVASHGHTIYHSPENGFSFQIGSGHHISALTQTPVIYDFRSLDIALGGQGAPLVPGVEKLLYPEYDCFLNLGGIANVSFHHNMVSAFDICVCNMLLNYLSNELGQPFDDNGTLARQGKPAPDIVDHWNNLPYHHQSPPKSLGREWFEEHIEPTLDGNAFDLLRSGVEFISDQIACALDQDAFESVLVTGGGAFNGFLMERISEKVDIRLTIPEKTHVAFKEAYSFAALGYLRLTEKVNTLSSVTGASKDSIGGSICIP